MKIRRILTAFLTMGLVLSWGVAVAQSPKVNVNAVPRVDPLTDLDVSDSRHNLGGNSNALGAQNTTQVCVFCHTPHFANTDFTDVPLWNRNTSGTSYVVYTSSTMDTTPGQPDGGSVGCLSCHDGTVAFDSLVNAPGPGGVAGYTVSGSENATFLNNPSYSLNYSFEIFGFVLDKPTNMVVVANTFGNPAGLIGTDLSNDHPISMVYPTAAQDPAFNQPPGTPGSDREFPNGIRTFEADKVQCASCHEPHLSDTAAEAKELRPFLRVNNTGSAVCLTCHIK